VSGGVSKLCFWPISKFCPEQAQNCLQPCQLRRTPRARQNTSKDDACPARVHHARPCAPPPLSLLLRWHRATQAPSTPFAHSLCFPSPPYSPPLTHRSLWSLPWSAAAMAGALSSLPSLLSLLRLVKPQAGNVPASTPPSSSCACSPGPWKPKPRRCRATIAAPAGIHGYATLDHHCVGRSHHGVRTAPLVLPRHFFVADVPPNRRKTRVRAPPLF